MKSEESDLMSSYQVVVGPYAWCDYQTDGTADDVQIQSAIDAVYANGGGTVKLCVDNYDISATITLKPYVTLEGANNPLNGGYQYSLSGDQASRFRITFSSATAIRACAGSCIRWISFYYPNQVTNSTPTAYPATITTYVYSSIPAEDITIEECMTINSYIFIDASSAHERMRVLRCAGYPLYKGVVIDNCTDIDYVEGNHWNPNYNPWIGETLVNWVRHNGTGFDVKSSDWGKFLNNFACIYQYGIYAEGTGVIYITNCGFDACNRGIYLKNVYSGIVVGNHVDAYEDSQSTNSTASGIVIEGVDARDSIVSGNTLNSAGFGIYVNAKRTQVIGNNIAFNGCSDGYQGIKIESNADNSIVADNICSGWGHANGSGISAESGAVGIVISGNICFDCPAYGYYIANGCTNFNLVNNIYTSCGTGVSDNSGSVTKTVSGNIAGS